MSTLYTLVLDVTVGYLRESEKANHLGTPQDRQFGGRRRLGAQPQVWEPLGLQL